MGGRLRQHHRPTHGGAQQLHRQLALTNWPQLQQRIGGNGLVVPTAPNTHGDGLHTPIDAPNGLRVWHSVHCGRIVPNQAPRLQLWH